MSSPALTTIFTPPASCFDNSYTLVGNAVWVKDTAIASSQCYPTSFHALFIAASPYSPGVCPASYTIAATSEYSGTVASTAAVCCPTGFANPPGGGLGCLSLLSSNTVLAAPNGSTTVSAGVQLAVHGIYIVLPVSAGVMPSGSMIVTETLQLTTSPPKTTTPSAISITSADAFSLTNSSVIPAPPSTSAAPATPLPSPTSHHLSIAAKAGIGVGVSVTAIALLTLLGWLIVTLRRRSAHNLSIPPPELQDSENAKNGMLHTRNISELSSENLSPYLQQRNSEPVEADSRAIPSELAGS